MGRLPDKPAFEIVSKGYLEHYGDHTELVPYGAVVCHTLNKWFGLPETPQYLKDAPAKQKRLHETLSRIRPVPILAELKDPRLKDLKKIVTDRDNYSLEYGRVEALFHENVIEVQSLWDSERQQVIQRLYTDNIDDLLLYDVGVVLERRIIIRQCYCGRYFIVGRGSRKYCSEHSKEGADKARYQNRKNDRCKSLYCKIYNRLRVAPYCGFDAFNSEYNRLLSLEASGKITEEEKFLALQELDEKYRLRKSKR